DVAHLGASVAIDLHPAPPPAHDQRRTTADEAEAAPLLAVLHALEQEAAGLPADRRPREHGRQRVGEQRARHGHDGRAFGERGELFERHIPSEHAAYQTPARGATRARMSQPTLAETDPEIAELIHKEEQRQHDVVRLIPSENYASRAVLEAGASALNNKYS